MYWKILGIAPTSDIKEIKKAYAVLAKKYNPEEHPEEFQRIHDAYKAATRYARSVKEHGNVEKNIPPQELSQMKVSCEEAINDATDKKCNLNQTGNSSDIGNKSREAEEKTTYDFSKVKSYESKPLSPITPEQITDSVIHKFNEIINDFSLRRSQTIWQNFFNNIYVRQSVNDTGFRKNAEQLIDRKRFTLNVAQELVIGFGGKARLYFDKTTSNAYVDVNGNHRQSYYFKSPLAKNILTVFVVVIIMIVVPFLLMLERDDDSYDQYEHSKPQYSNYQIPTIPNRQIDLINEEAAGKPFDEVSFSHEALYNLAVAYWHDKNNNIMMYIKEDRTYYCFINGSDTERGEVPSVEYAEKGAEVLLVLSGENDEYTFKVSVDNDENILAELTMSSGKVIMLEML